MNTKEETDKKRYSHCNNSEEREDLIFLFPDEFNKDPIVTADKMQKIVDFLKGITDLDPTKFFEQRVVVGYRHFDDENKYKKNPIWTPHRISIPWQYDKKEPDESLDFYNSEEQPLDCCTHELVHPFFRCSSLRKKNKVWEEPFREFLRGPLKTVVGLGGDEWWKGLIENAQKKLNSYRNPAGQFVLKAYEEYQITHGG